MSHDQNFKNLILEYPQQALAFLAGDEAEGLERGARVTPLRQEQLQQRLGERFRELDVALQVEWPNGERAALLFVIEEETRSRRFDLYRLAHYCLDLAVLCATDRVVPVVVFLDDGAARQRLRLGGERRTYLDFHYLACHLPRLPYRAYRDSDNLVARLNLPNMAWSTRAEKLDAYAAAVRGLLGLESDAERRRKYADFIDIYAGLDDNERREYERAYPQESEAMAGLVQQSWDEGLEQGVRRGEARSVLLILESRFGRVPPELRARIEALEAEQLEALIPRALRVADPVELLSDD